MRRTFALLQAVWLALLIAEPGALHACAMHGSGHGVHAVPISTTDAAADEHAHHHADADAPSDIASTDAPNAEHCQCLGECCATALAALPSVNIAESRVQYVDASVAPSVARLHATRAPDLRLPFAHAPPGPLTV